MPIDDRPKLPYCPPKRDDFGVPQPQAQRGRDLDRKNAVSRPARDTGTVAGGRGRAALAGKDANQAGDPKLLDTHMQGGASFAEGERAYIRKPRLESLMAPAVQQASQMVVRRAPPVPNPAAMLGLGKSALVHSETWYKTHFILERRKIVKSATGTYVKGSTRANGTYGKISWGLDLTGGQFGRRVAIKEIRQNVSRNGKLALTKDGRKKTSRMSPEQALEEFFQAKELAETFAAELPQLEASLWPSTTEGSSSPLAAVCTRSTAAPLFDFVYDAEKQKSFIITDLALGDVQSIVSGSYQPGQERVPLQLLADLISSFGAQISMQLQVMHVHRNTVHQDIKLANMVFDQHGAVWVTDLGLAKQMNNQGRTVSLGYCGSMLSPEMTTGETMTHKVDLHALAASLTSMMVSDGVRNIFYWPMRFLSDAELPLERQGQGILAQGPDYARGAQLMGAVDNYLQQLQVSSSGRLQLPRDKWGQYDRSNLPKSGEPDVDRFFKSCALRCPEQLEILLPFLWSNLAKRPPASEMTLGFGAYLPAANTPRANKLKQFFATRPEAMAQAFSAQEDQRYAALAGLMRR